MGAHVSSTMGRDNGRRCDPRRALDLACEATRAGIVHMQITARRIGKPALKRRCGEP